MERHKYGIGNTKEKSDLGVTSTQIGQAREFSVSSFASDYNKFLEDFNMNLKESTVCGYTMSQAQKIIGNAPVRTMALDTNDPDYAALMELYRQYRYEEARTSLSMMSAAFALGRAIGVRDERARRNGKVVVQPEQAEIDAAVQAIKRAEVTREIAQGIHKLDATELGATAATMKAMAEGKSDIKALEAGNAVLIAGGRKPLDITEILRNAASLRSA